MSGRGRWLPPLRVWVAWILPTFRPNTSGPGLEVWSDKVGSRLGRWGVGEHILRFSYRLDLTEHGPNGSTFDHQLHDHIQYWTPNILTSSSHPTPSPLPSCASRRILRHHPLPPSAHSVPTEEPALDQLPRLPGGETPADTMEGRALQGNTTSAARSSTVAITVTLARSSCLHYIPCRSGCLNIRDGRPMQCSSADTPAHLQDVATTQLPSSRARCQRSGAASTLRDLARRPIRLHAHRSRLTVVQPQLLHTWAVSTRPDYC